MILRISSFLAAFCLAIGAGPAPAGPQSAEPVGVGDVPADSHLPTAEPTDQTPAPAPAPAKKAKKAENEAPAAEAPASDAGAAAPAPADKAAAPAEGMSGSALIVALRTTGYTLVVRHANSPQAAPDKASADPENEKMERQLDAIGRQQAKMLGVAFRALDVPIGEILSSPAYRARETVEIARLGDPIVESELDEGGQGMAAASGAPSGSAAWLKAAVAKPPRKGTNRLIVTHFPLIVAAFGKEFADLAPAETLVLKPDGEGDAAVIGRLKIEDLKQLAGK